MGARREVLETVKKKEGDKGGAGTQSLAAANKRGTRSIIRVGCPQGKNKPVAQRKNCF